ncbi:MAG: bifunctional riboflavin kinase/FAD synthetase [Cypionkella sp.]
MRWLDHRNPVPEGLRGAIVALGNFDGFHLGHQAVAGEAIAWARAEGRPSVIATFDPHPVRYFKPDAAPFRLTTLEQRHELYTAAGATAMLVFHFDRALAETTAEDFVRVLLRERIGAAGVVTGEDFTFGRGRGGNRAVLEALGREVGIEARAVPPVMDGGAPVSSSRIRAALQAGDCDTATRLLTRPFAVRGVVQHGDKRGREIGYPTANLGLENYLRPRYGIYAVTGRLLASGEVLRGAANIGVRPQFDPPKELLEPYFFDFAGDLYGQEIEVAFHRFLRPEAKFDSLDALTAQMARDCDEARRVLALAV